ncbi:MAG: hypothetical protein HYR56_26070 [Acidobacteria bacterium]|nr:hypothetical protein [Acidobacteriota bacterium]MBI3427276.1 hypothetical protein [Acidobacteriota bacterium]
MLKQFFDALLSAYQIMQRVERLEKELKELRQEHNALLALVQRIAQEQQHAKERETDQHRLLRLEIENRILRAQRQLPQPGSATEE